MEHNLAPVLISVYTRLNHLKQCIASLQSNPLCKDTVLYIASDAAASQKDEAGVKQVRDYIATIDGFKEVVPILRKENMGARASIVSARDDIFTRYDTLIFLEDDNVVSPNFLAYINDGLAFYRDDPKAFSISGYNYPIMIPHSYPHDVYRWCAYSAWGVGVWRDKWQKVEWKYPPIEQIKQNKVKPWQSRKQGCHIFEFISPAVRSGVILGDLVLSYYMYFNELYSVFPVVSQVRNIGHDGSGEHCRKTDRFLNQVIDDGTKPIQFVKPLPSDHGIDRELQKYFYEGNLRIKISSMIPSNIRKTLRKIIPA